MNPRIVVGVVGLLLAALVRGPLWGVVTTHRAVHSAWAGRVSLLFWAWPVFLALLVIGVVQTVF